jgi:hypothetical protein
MNTNVRPADRHTIEARLGNWFAASLSKRAENVPHDVSERLRFARDQALSRASAARKAVPAGVTVVGVSARGAATLGGFVPWWQRAASVLPLLVLVIGLLAIDRWSVREQVLAAADIDAQLLSDDLPPAAYSDPGFAEFLRTGPAP